ncbi:MAG: hypothetical protein WDK95_06705 [Syntrophorhabdaceae bacterium]
MKKTLSASTYLKEVLTKFDKCRSYKRRIRIITRALKYLYCYYNDKKSFKLSIEPISLRIVEYDIERVKNLDKRINNILCIVSYNLVIVKNRICYLPEGVL